MGSVVTAEQLQNLRLEAFHRHLKTICASRGSFNRRIEIDMGHVLTRASQEDDQLLILLAADLRVAALITDGAINLDRCRLGPPLEIAIEGKFLNLRIVDVRAISERIIPCICARLVVRERQPKHLVVTVYPDHSNEINPATTPESRHEIW